MHVSLRIATTLSGDPRQTKWITVRAGKGREVNILLSNTAKTSIGVQKNLALSSKVSSCRVPRSPRDELKEIVL